MKLSDKSSTATTNQGALVPPLTHFTFLALLTGSLAIGGCSNQTAETTVLAEPTPPPAVQVPAETEAIATQDAVIEHVRKAQVANNSAVLSLDHSGSTHKRHFSSPLIARQPVYRPPVDYPAYTPTPTREQYPQSDDNPVQQVAREPVSTFSIDVDTAAYANTRRTINAGHLPERDAVRVEEFINYFNYSYAQPSSSEGPFSVTTEVGPSPWNSDRKLMLVGLQGYDIDRSKLLPANLVFLIDVSGSMNNPQKLGLLKSSMKMLTRQLRPQDTISIAVYAGAAGEVLEPTSGSEQRKILAAIDGLHAGGSTNGGAGINLAYALAESAQKQDGINRVILATDGDFNVGASSRDALGDLIETKRKTGVSLTVLGFGAGNYNDTTMQELAQKGNGNAAYIDTLNEARKVLVDEMGSTLETIAKDVKIQVEFNPSLVSEYRLIGYETRHLNREDFNNDKVDAGEIGAGHSVTALYELTMVDAARPSIDKLRYSGETDEPVRPAKGNSTELAHVKLRYKAPGADTSKLIDVVVAAGRMQTRLDRTSTNYRFAAAASAYGQLLRDSDYTGSFSYDDALALAQSARGQDAFGYRREFENLLRTTAALQGDATRPTVASSDDPERMSMR